MGEDRIKPFSEDISTGSEDISTGNEDFLQAEEIKLNLGSKQWQDLRKEIARWKKTGGTLHAKIVGKPDPKEAKELIAERGPKLTEEEEAKLYQTPGIIPPWYPKDPNEESYFYHAMKAIRELNVSAAEVLAAVDKEYDDESTLTERQRDILRVGWNQVFGEKNVFATIDAVKFDKLLTVPKAQGILDAVKRGELTVGWKTGEKYIIDKGLFRQAQKLLSEYASYLLDNPFPKNVKEAERFKKLLSIRYPVPSKTATKSTATSLAKHLLSRQGLKVTAKTFGKIVGKLTSTLASPWLVPLIWSPEIIDIATSKDVQKIWKNMQSEQWWKDAAKRDEIIREKIRKGEDVTFAEKNVIPRGSFYHKDIGWY